MPDSGYDERDHFIKQRRNLILISLFMIFYKVGKLDLEKVNFFGNETTVGNPEIVFYALIVFFVYLLWRYYTACRAVEGGGKFIASSKSWSLGKCKERVIKHILTLQDSYSDVYIKKWNWKELVYAYSLSRINNGIHEKVGKEMVFGPEIWHLRLWSPIYSIINHGAFSEYIFPYVIAVLAIAEMFGMGMIANIFQISI